MRADNAKLLISRGATIFFAYGRPEHLSGSFDPFCFAAASGQLEVLQHMVNHLPDGRSDRMLLSRINREDGTGLTPLYHAIANGHFETTVPYLIGLGADVNISIQYHHYPASTSRVDSEAVFQCIVEIPLLAELCRLGRFRDAAKLLDLGGTKLDSRSTETRITETRQAGPVFRTVVPLLHICCMSPLRDNREKVAPMRDIVSENSMDEWRSVVIKRLIDSGMDPNSVWLVGSDPGNTPLIMAARHGNITAIDTLLDAGADVRARNGEGRNALMTAMIQREQFDVIHVPGLGGNTDEEYRGDQVHASLAEEDRPELPGLTSTPGYIPMSRLTEIVQRLIEAGLCINDQDQDGFTALHLFFTAQLTSSSFRRTTTNSTITTLYGSSSSNKSSFGY